MKTYYFTSDKISYTDLNDLFNKLNSLRAAKIISITPCTPERTDTNNWVSVYYEYRKD